MKKQDSEKPVHMRRCHICGSINMSHENNVEQCEGCEKHLSPFFYFDERFSPVHGDTTMRPPLLDGEYMPILGLSAYWEN